VRYSIASLSWYEQLIAGLERSDLIDLFWQSLGVFSVCGQASHCGSGCVTSFDSLGIVCHSLQIFAILA